MITWPGAEMRPAITLSWPAVTRFRVDEVTPGWLKRTASSAETSKPFQLMIARWVLWSISVVLPCWLILISLGLNWAPVGAAMAALMLAMANMRVLLAARTKRPSLPAFEEVRLPRWLSGRTMKISLSAWRTSVFQHCFSSVK